MVESLTAFVEVFSCAFVAEGEEEVQGSYGFGEDALAEDIAGFEMAD